jgi:crotonobetainyl-CoA:carnitine CoA-transferase CaiB-like acyl-CoA transferase
VRHRGTLRAVNMPEIGVIELFGLSAQLSRTPGTITSAPPRLGADTAELLGELGYSADDVKALREKAVV